MNLKAALRDEARVTVPDSCSWPSVPLHSGVQQQPEPIVLEGPDVGGVPTERLGDQVHGVTPGVGPAGGDERPHVGLPVVDGRGQPEDFGPFGFHGGRSSSTNQGLMWQWGEGPSGVSPGDLDNLDLTHFDTLLGINLAEEYAKARKVQLSRV